MKRQKGNKPAGPVRAAPLKLLADRQNVACHTLFYMR